MSLKTLRHLQIFAKIGENDAAMLKNYPTFEKRDKSSKIFDGFQGFLTVFTILLPIFFNISTILPIFSTIFIF